MDNLERLFLLKLAKNKLKEYYDDYEATDDARKRTFTSPRFGHHYNEPDSFEKRNYYKPRVGKKSADLWTRITG